MRKDIDFFIKKIEQLVEQVELINEGVRDDVIKKWKEVDPNLDLTFVKQYINIYDQLKGQNFNGAFNEENDITKSYGLSLNDLKDITKYPNFKTFENAMDYAKNKTAPTKGVLDDTLEFVDTKPVYADNDIEIYLADSRNKCIAIKNTITDRTYSWCIADANIANNAFYSYRFNNQNTIYMVKNLHLIRDKKFNDIWHFFVVQPTQNKGTYLLTSAQNGDDKYVSFSEIVKHCPYLKGKEHIFKPIPLTDLEKKYWNKFKDGISEEEFLKLPPEEKEIYLDIAVPKNHENFTLKMFLTLNDKLRKKYLNFGLPLNSEFVPYVEKNKELRSTYLKKLKVRFDRFANDESGEINETDFDMFAKYFPEYVITTDEL